MTHTHDGRCGDLHRAGLIVDPPSVRITWDRVNGDFDSTSDIEGLRVTIIDRETGDVVYGNDASDPDEDSNTRSVDSRGTMDVVERQEVAMRFAVSISGSKDIELADELDGLREQAEELLSDELQQAGFEVDDTSAETPDPVDVTVSFSATYEVELSDEDVRQLVSDQVEQAAAEAGVRDIDVDSIESV